MFEYGALLINVGAGSCPVNEPDDSLRLFLDALDGTPEGAIMSDG